MYSDYIWLSSYSVSRITAYHVSCIHSTSYNLVLYNNHTESPLECHPTRTEHNTATNSQNTFTVINQPLAATVMYRWNTPLSHLFTAFIHWKLKPSNSQQQKPCCKILSEGNDFNGVVLALLIISGIVVMGGVVWKFQMSLSCSW